MKIQTYSQIISNPFSVHLIDLPKPTQKIYLRLIIKAGRCFAPKNNKELPHLLEHYLANQFMQKKEDYSAFVDFEYLDFFLLANKNNIETKLKLFLKTLLQPDFDNETVLDNEKKAIDNETKDNIITPEKVVYQSVINTRFMKNSHYYVNSKLTNTDKNITLKDIGNYYNQFCHGGNITLFIGTHQPSPELTISIKNIILSTKAHNDKTDEFPSAQYSKFSIAREKILTKRIYLTLSWPGPSHKDNVINLCLLNCAMSLLVQGQEGRLFQALRVENNLVYGVNGLTQSLNKVGFVAVSTAVETKDTLQAIDLIIKEINKIKNGKINKKQLIKYLSESIKFTKKGWHDNWKKFDWVSQDIVHQQQLSSPETISNFNNKILNNPQLISTAVKKYLNHRYLNIILVGREVKKIDLSALKF